jgi:SAM-dependent methyltransferase
MAVAPNYADWTYSLFERFVRGDVLEVGCGIGTFTRRLAASSAIRHLLSIDVSADALSYCRTSIHDPRIEWRLADVGSVVDSFDLVLCMNVLEHIEDDEGTMQHLLGLVRPGGTLFLLVPAHRFLYSAFDVESGHHRRYTRRSMNDLLARAGRGKRLQVSQFYFNSLGAIGYFVVYRVLRKPPRANAGAEIGWFDRVVVPALRRIERNRSPFGISLVNVITAGGA